MSVLKSKRKESPFEVFHHLYKIRKEITDLLLRDFGYSDGKAIKYLEKKSGGKSFEELTGPEKEFTDWFNSWFANYYKTMSRAQRESVKALFRKLKEEYYV